MKHYSKFTVGLSALTIAILIFGIWIAVNARHTTPTDCGEIRSQPVAFNYKGSGNFINLSDADYTKLNDCFVSAYNQKRPAKIYYYEQGVDTSSSDTFITKNGNITDEYQYNGLMQGSDGTGKCKPLHVSNDGVEIICTLQSGDSDNLFSTQSRQQIK